MKKNTLLMCVLASLTAAPVMADEVPAADVAVMRDMAGKLAGQLAGELKKELTSGSPESAIQICRDKAPAIAGELSRQTGWKITRVSLKVRNPLLGSSDAWEQQALTKLQERLTAGEKPETLEVVEIVQEPAGRFLRYAKGLPIQMLCLNCHATPAKLDAGVQGALASAYPKDQATGYAAGMLRGAVSIKKPLGE